MEDTTLKSKDWPQVYWLYAGALPLILFTLEAFKLLIYPETRAPNVHVMTHIDLMGVFYGLWVWVPRLVWQKVTATQTLTKALALRLAVLGLALSTTHLFILALILRVIYSPPGWGLIHVLNSTGEVWLGYIGYWTLAYLSVTVMILRVVSPDNTERAEPTRLEVRHNGKIISVPFTDIYWIKAAGNYAELYTATGVYTVRQTLKQTKSQLPTATFLPSHRGALVNSRHVISIAPDSESGTYSVLLTGDHVAPLSRRNLTSFKTLLKSAP